MTSPVREEATTCVRFADGVHDLEAIKRAAYELSDRVSIDIAPDGAGITCTLHPRSAKTNLTAAADAFRVAALDHDLRIRIAKETEPLRNLILSVAFSKTGLQG
jgi:His-Xaa-Ser system protein HxsD